MSQLAQNTASAVLPPLYTNSLVADEESQSYCS